VARLYADEDFHFGVVERLRNLGHDVVTVQGAGRSGSSDPQVLGDATADNRAVLTFNRRDFARLHQQSAAHAGIISCTRDDDLDALAARIDKAIAATGALAGQHLRVNRPPPP
jgi:prophage DNA circulation protein